MKSALEIEVMVIDCLYILRMCTYKKIGHKTTQFCHINPGSFMVELAHIYYLDVFNSKHILRLNFK